MTGLEQLLLELDKLKLEVAMQDINDQIVYYSKHRRGVEGISLMTIRDLVKHSDDFLRSNGFILSVSQFKEDCEKYLKLATIDPILYNKNLKRLHRSFVVLKREYESGRIHNEVVSEEMQKHFKEVIQSCYSNGGQVKMHPDITARIDKMTLDVVEKLNVSWFKKDLPSDLMKEFSALLASDILKDWRLTNLAKPIETLLVEEKKRINSVEALVTHFRLNRMPGQAQDSIKKAIIDRLSADVDGEVINELSPLGSTISNLYNKKTKKDYFSTFSEIIQHWQSNQLSPDAAEQLKKTVEGVISGMRVDLEKTFSQQFEQLAVERFVESLLNGPCSTGTLDEMKSYALSMAKTTLRFMKSCNPTESSPCSEFISNTVMNLLHNEWVTCTIPLVEREFIGKAVFASLNELDEKVQHNVWKHESLQSKQFDAMQGEIAELKQMIVKLASQIQQSSKASVTNTTAVVSVEDKPAETSSSVSFFGRK